MSGNEALQCEWDLSGKLSKGPAYKICGSSRCASSRPYDSSSGCDKADKERKPVQVVHSQINGKKSSSGKLKIQFAFLKNNRENNLNIFLLLGQK
jgi:hypothetical protein